MAQPQQSYRNINGLPMHARAGTARAGNAREHYHHMGGAMGGYGYGRGKGMMMPHGGYGGHPAGLAGGHMGGNACHFPKPAPKRCYCQAAPFATLGPEFHRLNDAYGHSAPCSGY